MKTHIDIELLPKRAYERLPWQMREVKKKEVVDKVRECLLTSPEKPQEPVSAVEIGIRVGRLPEHTNVEPVLLVLRNDGWISDNATVILTPSTQFGIFIAI